MYAHIHHAHIYGSNEAENITPPSFVVFRSPPRRRHSGCNRRKICVRRMFSTATFAAAYNLYICIIIYIYLYTYECVCVDYDTSFDDRFPNAKFDFVPRSFSKSYGASFGRISVIVSRVDTTNGHPADCVIPSGIIFTIVIIIITL